MSDEDNYAYTNRGYVTENSRVQPIVDELIENPIERHESLRLDQFRYDKKAEVKVNSENNADANVDDDDDEHMDESFKNETFFGRAIIATRNRISYYAKKPIIKWLALALAAIGFIVYFSFAMARNNPFYFPSDTNSTSVLQDYVFNNNKGLALFVLTVFVGLMLVWDNVIAKHNSLISESVVIKPVKDLYSKFLTSLLYSKLKKYSKYTRWSVTGIVFILCVTYLAIDLKDAYNLVSLLGIFLIVFLSALVSTHPSHIQWNTLVCGLLTQFVLGVFVLRVQFGNDLFKFLGEQVSRFLAYTDYGSRLVFGDNFTDHFFVFKAMPVIIFFSSIVNFLYYVGAIQYIILKLSWIVNKLMATSPTESMNATANIFLGQNEAPLLIKPFLPKMTLSEIFAVMVGGFATVAGSTLAAYIGFGVPANNLISASIMAAPAGLAISKVMYPETKFTSANWDAIKQFPKGEATNILEAFSLGATAMVGPIGAIVSNLIAFTAIFQFFDSIVAWIFSFVGLTDFGFSSILQYIFWPFAFFMGTASEDCLAVGKLIGIKLILNELIAYRSLGATIKYRDMLIANNTFELYRNGVAGYDIPSNITMIWNDRSISIATFALCGFANFASIGIQIAGLAALAPTRSKAFARLAFKAMIGGNLASFTNACISGK